jgi:hypothetical protein
MTPISIGRLLRSNTSSCVIGCKVSQQNAPVFGEMVRIPLSNGVQIYGLVHEIHIDDDGLVRQLVTAAGISDEVIEDNRQNRNMPVEMSVAFIGWEIFTCGEDEITRFLASGKFGYLRALLRNEELPAANLITAHLRQVTQAERASSTIWMENSLREVIALLKDDYPILMDVLSAVSEISE